VIRSAEQRRWRIVAATMAALFGGVIAYGVSGGRQIVALRAPFVIGVAAVGAAVVFALAPRAARWLAPRASLRWRGAVVLAVVLTIALVELTNAVVLPRLYPAFHMGLTVLAVLLAPPVRR
jgi:hypothetical protein